MTAGQVVDVGRVGARVARIGNAGRRRRPGRRARETAAAVKVSWWVVAAHVVRKTFKGLLVTVGAWLRWTTAFEHFKDVQTSRQAARQATTTAEKKQSMMVVKAFRRLAGLSLAMHTGSGLLVAGGLYGLVWWMANHRPLILPGFYGLVLLVLYYVGDAFDTRPAPAPRPAPDLRDMPLSTGAAIISALRASVPKLDALYERRYKAAADDPSSFVPPIKLPRVRETADGLERCEVRLPNGFKWSQIDTELFAGALGEEETKVHLAKGKTPGDVDITILPVPLAQRPAPPWPHLDDSTVDPFAGVHIGVNPAGRPVIVDIAESSTAITGEPRTGKTDLLRKLAAAHAMVPNSQLVVVNGKANGDFLPVEQLAAVSIIGAEASDQAMLADALDWLADEIKSRNAAIRDYATEAPNQKLNPWLLENLGWGTLAVVIDEANLFTRGKHAGRILEGLEYVAEKGPSVGGSIVIGSQRFSASNMATEILSMCHNVAAFKLDSHTETTMSFGGSWSGPKPHLFGSDGDDSGDLATAKAQGVCAFKGALRGGKLVRCSETTIGTLAPTLDRVRAAKAAAGQILGHAAGVEVVTASGDSIEVDTDRSGLLQRIAAVCPDTDVIATGELVVRLVDRWPNDYDGLTVTKLGRDLSGIYGLPKATDSAGRRGYDISATKLEADRVAA